MHVYWDHRYRCYCCRYHPKCVHASTAAVRGGASYTCPLCLHLSGSASELGTAPPANFYRAEGVDSPTVAQLQTSVTAAAALPVRSLKAQDMLTYVCDIASNWTERCVLLQPIYYMYAGVSGLWLALSRVIFG